MHLVVRALLRRAPALLLALLAGCASTAHYPVNPARPVAQEAGYRLGSLPAGENSDSLAVILTFSGGGARAAALAYGVLEELRRQEITWEGRRRRLLDEVDLIYAVSGGSLVAGYYALRGEALFDDFEARFLRRDNQTDLAGRVLSNLNRLSSPRFGRVEVLAEYLDETLFGGARYDAVIERAQRPFVVINATDMSLGARFEFTQDQFDLICADLGDFPLSRAVAASMAVPFVFGPLTLVNHAGDCAAQRQPLLESLGRLSRREEQRARELRTYLDAAGRPYVHLLDGGLSDNLGLRGPLETVQPGHSRAPRSGLRGVRRVVFIVVNAESKADLTPDRSADVPTLGQQLKAVSDIPLNRYSFETAELLRSTLEQWRAERARRGLRPDADLHFHLVEVDPQRLADGRERDYFLAIPTTLSLTEEQSQRLRAVAARLLYESPEYQRLLEDLK
ncbi:MAG TPA: patatin-like phospholipase family protein [Burkholderiales bacterium]|nr:patatin-like phospholipase family protein [Burkholderiales bacterium]